MPKVAVPVRLHPTESRDVWEAESRSEPSVRYLIDRPFNGNGWRCDCPARVRCAHIDALDELLAAGTPAPAYEWNDIAPVRVSPQPKGNTLAGFTKATKQQSKLRMALIGPSGSGKTYTALAIAKGLDLGKIAFIDTERGSASKYADSFDFDVLTLDPPFTVEKYIEAIQMAGDAGYGVLIIDSLSHAWAGAGGVLEFVDNRKKASGGKDGFSAWGDATPKQNHFIDAILGSSCHVIATMRSKMTYVQEKDERTGKFGIVKLGLQPIQRDGVEYEFDIIGDLDENNNLVISKTRASNLSEYVAHKPGAELAGMIRTWLLDGVKSPKDYPWYPELSEALKVTGLNLSAITDPIYAAVGMPKPGNKDTACEVIAAWLAGDQSRSISGLVDSVVEARKDQKAPRAEAPAQPELVG